MVDRAHGNGRASPAGNAHTAVIALAARGTVTMNPSPHRIAWTVLFAALFICVALAVGVPAGIYGYVNNATNAAAMRVSLQSGILTSFSPVESIKDARVVDLAGREFKEEHTVVAGDRSYGLLTFAHTAAEAPYVQVQLYSNAQATVLRARSPRFELSTAPDEFALTLNAGRIDVLADPPPNRRFVMLVSNPLGEVRITEAGQYTIEVLDGHMRATTHTGSANLSSKEIAAGTSAATDASGIVMDEPAPVNLLRDGNFQVPLQANWTFTTEVNSPTAVRGTISRTTRDDRSSTLLIERTGENIGWGRTSINQRIDADIAGATDVRMRIVFAILDQQLAICGSEGTECPLMVRIDYVAKDGRDDFWLQGFYAKGDPSIVKLPDYVRSNFRGNHIAKPLGVQQIFESENLHTLLGAPRIIRSITLYAEGHALRTRIDEVEMMIMTSR
jgi:hypothetical protein